jgi:hypothetical protein
MRPVAAALVVAAALLVAGTPAITGAAAGCAAAAGPHAALVVDAGARPTAYCVSLDAPTVSGIHLIQLAAGQHGLTYGLGFGGQAVCRLQGIGPAGDDCFAAYPRYWGYWHGDGHGGWTWASSGAGSAMIHNGDVDGWVWGTGDSATTHPTPPHIGIDTICAPASAPTPAPPPSATATTASAAPSRDTASPAPGRTPSSAGPVRPSPGRAASPSPRPATPTPDVQIVAGAPPTDPPGGSGIPPGLPLAVALAVAFAAGGIWRVRRKDAHP